LGPMQLPAPKGNSTSHFSPLLWRDGRPSQQLLSCCCTAHSTESLYFPLILPLPMGYLNPHLIHIVPWAHAHPSRQAKRHLDRFSHVCTAHGKAKLPRTLQWAAIFPKMPFPWGSEPHSWFLGYTRVCNPNGISIGSAVFAGLTTMTDQWTTLLSL